MRARFKVVQIKDCDLRVRENSFSVSSPSLCSSLVLGGERRRVPLRKSSIVRPGLRGRGRLASYLDRRQHLPRKARRTISRSHPTLDFFASLLITPPR
jgi:hypothetical protein